MQEPRVHRGHARNFAHGHATLERITNVRQPVRMWSYQTLRQPARLDVVGGGLLARLERPYRLHHRFLEGAPNRHDLADRLHLRPQALIRAGKLLELPLWNLYDDIVDRRLEAGRSRLGDVVLNLVERVADSEARSNLCNRKTGSLRSQRGRPRNSRIHLDYRHAAIQRIH